MLKRAIALVVCSFVVVGCGGGGGGVGGFAVSSDVSGSQSAGFTSTWIAAGGGPTAAYKFSVGKVGEALRVIYDFSGDGIFEWTPLEEGDYVVAVDARVAIGGPIDTEVFEISVDPIATTEPVVLPTPNPLVAIYGVPPCEDGSSVRVLFRPVGATEFDSTDLRPCVASRSTNFYIAGMRGNTTYEMFHEILSLSRGERVLGPQVLFNTGESPILIPIRTVISPLSGMSSISDDVILHTTIFGTVASPGFPFATDLNGELVWYVEDFVNGIQSTLTRMVSGGTVLVQNEDNLQEIDLGGNVVRQTNIQRLNEQLMARDQDTITATHHEIRRIPGGRTVTLGYVERLFQDVQGAGLVNVLGDMLIVLDENFQVEWVWNPFDHLDVARPAILGQVCAEGVGGCPGELRLGGTANDWMHTNGIDYSPSDGNLILSVRHQDWIVKIDYRDGSGTGDVVWRLGSEGDFTLPSGDPNPWFSHQHDPNYIANNRIAVYDNGNTRVVGTGSGNSRGQVYDLNETMMTATLVTNADLGHYSRAVGSAQLLSNGNLHFGSGFRGALSNPFTSSHEVLPDGSLDYGLRLERSAYRSFRVPNLYTPPPGTN